MDTASVGSVSDSSDISLFVAKVEGIYSVGVDKDLSDHSCIQVQVVVSLDAFLCDPNDVSIQAAFSSSVTV